MPTTAVLVLSLGGVGVVDTNPANIKGGNVSRKFSHIEDRIERRVERLAGVALVIGQVLFALVAIAIVLIIVWRIFM